MSVVLDHSTAWMTGPTNVQARRIAPTVLQVSWDRPPYDAILGYRIYYDVHPDKEMEQWDNTEVLDNLFTAHCLTPLENSSRPTYFHCHSRA